MKQEIVTLPKESLRVPSSDVRPAEIASMKKLVRSMFRTMKESGGIGLAASQIGKNINLFVIDKELAKASGIPAVYFNARMRSFSGKEEAMEEGCLSAPGKQGLVRRARKVSISACDEKGRQFSVEAEGFAARVLQHEYDHLQGTLIVDKMIHSH